MDAIDELLTRGVDSIYPNRQTLEKVLRAGKKLRLYQGFDPSGIQLHIGHLTGLRKLRQFQDLGHQVIFLIGDGTGQAGDPSGKTRNRERYLSQEELRANAKDYVMQAHKVVRFEGKNAAEILYNGDWLNKLGLVDVLNLAGHFSLQQLEERDIFEKRKMEGILINFREFLYPLLQGYDSVAMNVDLEIGGTDQTFNMLAGRKLVREMQGREKYVLTTPLLTDAKGQKIGKTEGNVIALNAPPNEFYGLVMTLPDDVIAKAFEYITDVSMEDAKSVKEALQKGSNPMEYKKKLAYTLTRMLNSDKEAGLAQEYFEKTFQEKQTPTQVQTWKLKGGETNTIVDVLVSTQLAKSRSDAKRLIREKAVELDGKPILDINQTVAEGVLKVGKHKFIKITKE